MMLNLTDYRSCKYMTKTRLQETARACGKSLDPTSMKKDEMIKAVQTAQKQIITTHGQLYPGEY